MQATAQSFSEVALSISVVWLPMLDGDGRAAAVAAARLVPDGRAQHFYDPGRRAGEAIGAGLGGPGSIAWDTYLAYGPGAAWDAAPPPPDGWVHQLTSAAWPDPLRYRSGEGLLAALGDLVRAVAVPPPPR